MKALFTQTSLKWLWLTVVWLAIDQLSKYWVVDTMQLHQSIEILPFFNFTYVQNPGAAFSFLADQTGWQRWFFTVIASIASIVFIYWLAKTPKEQRCLGVAFALMLSGALGNLIDRVLFGYVIDFIDIYIGVYRWPAFNVADSVIFVGAALMIVDSFINSPEKANVEKNKT